MTEQPKDDMATLNAALHGDKRTVLQEQLKEIDREILEYMLLELAQRHDLHEEIWSLRDQYALLKPNEAEPDDPTKRKDRLKVQEAILNLGREERELQLHVRDTTKDLRREEREKQAELLQTNLREKRLDDL
jgi:hypothetical protein